MNGSSAKGFFCWDSCMFLAWFNKEQDKPLPAIEAMLRRIVDGKEHMLISAISYAEVLDRAGESDAGTQFRGFAKRDSVVVADTDPRIGILAAEIRQGAIAALANGALSKSIKAPDALIVATAIIYRANALYTFDPVLQEVDGWPLVKKMRIVPPSDSPSPLGF